MPLGRARGLTSSTGAVIFFIMPSRAEAFGVVLAEASAFGVPSLATDVGGLASVITDNVNGRLFKRDARGREYADYIAAVMADPASYRAFALRTAAVGAARLSWNVCGRQVAEILEDVVHPPSAADPRQAVGSPPHAMETIAPHPVLTAADPPATGLWGLPASGWISLSAGFFTAFTVSLVGEMPLGELVLMAAAGWAALCVIFNRAWPGPLLESRFFRALLVAQLVALGAYIATDLYRHSLPHDMARGWSRMIFLAVDCTAVAYLFGRQSRNFTVFLLGQFLGDLAHLGLAGAMFGDLWKFGIGAPVTYLLVYLAPWAGPFAGTLAACGAGALNLLLDYRSLGGLCLAVGVATPLQLAPRRLRWWLAPFAVAAALGGATAIYRTAASDPGRATRSDIERSAMITAAFEAFQESPFVGHGSWFSNSRVYDNFMSIRHELARTDHVGGFADANTDPGDTTLHSQILVALAEGGLFGGAFFFVYGAGLLWALYDLILVRPWHRLAPLFTLFLLSALWDLFFSPFSGAHRVVIAEACGLILILQHESSARRQRRPLSP